MEISSNTLSLISFSPTKFTLQRSQVHQKRHRQIPEQAQSKNKQEQKKNFSKIRNKFADK